MTSDYAKWYEENKEKYNEARRKRYAANESVREKAKERASEYRKKPKDDREPKFSIKVVDGVEMKLWATGDAALQIGIHKQTIPKWEAQGYIGPPAYMDRRRWYAAHQLVLMDQLRKLLKRGNRGLMYAAKKQKFLETLHKAWPLKETQ